MAEDQDAKLVSKIKGSNGSSTVAETKLQTSERVIARVTDGIYRQPGSAIRELISNAYDADATKVVIKTSVPRFDRISVEDDGHGMTAEALVHLLHHIGGSAKRSDSGADLGVTSNDDPTLSPKGRKLIGKIGIGLFSVSQLTHTFQIITKIKGDDFRIIATVVLRQHQDEAIHDGQGEDHFESGKVKIWREKASDVESHGTSIILTCIKPQAQDTLRSREIWSIVDHNLSAQEEDKQAIDPPLYNMGRVDSTGALLIGKGVLANPPWLDGDSPKEAFRKMVDCVWLEAEKGTAPNVRLETLFDYYLRMIWQISLAIPLPYIDSHIFDLNLDGWASTYLLSNQPKGSAEAVKDAPFSSIREKLELVEPSVPLDKFEVYFDNLLLSRPIKFEGLPSSGNALKKPIAFVGKCREEFPKIPKELGGTPLEFEAYLFWNPKIAPLEHQGALIRINGASGTLFDSTFMRYQISEQTRLRQITCEIFIHEGLDSALNIDRESFNNAHTHSVFLTKWLHGALRQLATVQKRLAAEVRNEAQQRSSNNAASRIADVASHVWRREVADSASEPPSVEISATGDKTLFGGNSYVLRRAEVIGQISKNKRNTKKGRSQQKLMEEKLKAIIQVIASFGLFDKLPKAKQEHLAKAIFQIIDTDSDAN